jgi:hypothetical protein
MTNRKAPVNDIPEPHYTLIETSRGPDPAIVVVNSALRAFQHRDWLPWHLSIHISCPFLGDNGTLFSRPLNDMRANRAAHHLGIRCESSHTREPRHAG